jgi:Ca2+-binding EF-hand superfamily protein
LTLASALAFAPVAFAQSTSSGTTAPSSEAKPAKPKIGAAERQAHRARAFDSMDLNKDGKLTEQEVIDQAVAQAKERYARMDPAKKGSVTKEEFLAPKERGSVLRSDRHNRVGQPEGAR